MNLIRKKVSDFDTATLTQMISDCEKFEEDGLIGDCTLRTKAEEICAEFDSPHVVIWMNQLAFEAYLELYRRTAQERDAARAEVERLRVLLLRMREDGNLEMRLWQWHPAIDAALAGKDAP